ncbi:hypothetical protein ACFSLT_06880 [Novosphingobium resinovorum]
MSWPWLAPITPSRPGAICTAASRGAARVGWRVTGTPLIRLPGGGAGVLATLPPVDEQADRASASAAAPSGRRKRGCRGKTSCS